MSFLSNLMAQGEQLANQIAPGKLERFLSDLKVNLAKKTNVLVYNSCHERGINEPLRAIMEAAIENVPLRTPKALSAPVVALLNKLEFEVDAERKTKEVGIAGFINDVIKRNHLDSEIRRSALRGFKRFLEEHKDFIKNVGSEALLQKLQNQPISTEKSVVYSVPSPLPLDVFDKEFPDDEEASGNRGLFGSLLEGAINSIGSAKPTLVQSVMSAVQNDPSVQAKLDEYAQEIKGKVCESTQRTVYEQAHSQKFHLLLRKLIETAIEKLELNSPVQISNKVSGFLSAFAAKDESGKRDLNGSKGFFMLQIEKLGLDTEAKYASMRAFERYMVEHKQFFTKIGVLAVKQKLQDQKISTTASIPYEKPPVLTVEQFDLEHPDRHRQKTEDVATASSAAPAAGAGVAASAKK